MSCESNSEERGELFKRFYRIVKKRSAGALLELLNGPFSSLVNTCSDDGWPPLHTAASLGFVEGIGILLRAGARTDLTRPDGYTPLMSALARNQPEAAAALVRAGADVNRVLDKPNPWSPLLLAAGYCPDAVGPLLAGGADPDLSSYWNRQTPFHMAVNHGFFEAAKLIHGAGGNPFAVTEEGQDAATLARVRLHNRDKFGYMADRPWDEIVSWLEALESGLPPEERGRMTEVHFSKRFAINSVGMEFVLIGTTGTKRVFLGRSPVSPDQCRASTKPPGPDHRTEGFRSAGRSSRSPGEPGGDSLPGNAMQSHGAFELFETTVHAHAESGFIRALTAREGHLGIRYRLPRLEESLAMYHPGGGVASVLKDPGFRELERKMVDRLDETAFEFRAAAPGVTFSPFEVPGEIAELITCPVSPWQDVTCAFECVREGQFLCYPGDKAVMKKVTALNRSPFCLRLVMETGDGKTDGPF